MAVVSKMQSPRGITQEEIVAICLIKDQYWPYSMESQLQWWKENTDESDLFFILVKNNQTIAFLRLRTGLVAKGKDFFDAFCVTEVCVHKDYLRRGLGKQLLDVASMYIKKTDSPIGYLLCWDNQTEFYQKCGWRPISLPQIKSSKIIKPRSLYPNEKCMVYDPSNLISGDVVLFGDSF
jgi:GNAT superfamily N-acetyltransferase